MELIHSAIKLFFVVALLTALLTTSAVMGQMKTEITQVKSGGSVGMLKAEMRKLWEDHIVWTRNVIFCLADSLPGKDEAALRLLQNQADIGSLFKLYYGAESGTKLTRLLYSHINLFPEVVNAAKVGNWVALGEASKKWSANADEISEFWCSINPEWKLADMKMMMHNHLALATDEAMHRINKNYSADAATYDKIHNEILIMADMLADGIAKQFAGKFESDCYPLLAR
jgi:hypothetical protein